MIPLRIVLDTNICLDLFVFRDPACSKLHTALKNGDVKAFTAEACRSEWIRVLDYPQMPLDPYSKRECVAEFDAFVSFISPNGLSHIPLPSCSDADDQKFLELARDSKADYLISKDKALLKLNKKTSKSGLFSIINPFELNTLLSCNPAHEPFKLS